MRCRVVLCGAVLRCAVFRTYSTRYRATYQVPRTGMYLCTRVFPFLTACPASVLFTILFLQIYTRTTDQNVTSPASTQHSTGESGQVALGIINSLGAPNHGPLLSATFTCCCLLPCARVATSAARGAEPLCLSILICVLPVST